MTLITLIKLLITFLFLDREVHIFCCSEDKWFFIKYLAFRVPNLSTQGRIQGLMNHENNPQNDVAEP